VIYSISVRDAVCRFNCWVVVVGAGRDEEVLLVFLGGIDAEKGVYKVHVIYGLCLRVLAELSDGIGSFWLVCF